MVYNSIHDFKIGQQIDFSISGFRWCDIRDTKQDNYGSYYDMNTPKYVAKIMVHNGEPHLCFDTGKVNNGYFMIPESELIAKGIIKPQSNVKSMKKLFTVSGSLPLKKALIEELGYTEYGRISGAYNISPCEMPENFKKVQDNTSTLPTHYTLPSDYEAALQAFKDYYKKDVELVKDKWYKVSEMANGNIYFKYSHTEDDIYDDEDQELYYSVAILGNGRWIENDFVDKSVVWDYLSEATSDEVKEALLAECKRRYTDKDVVKSLSNNIHKGTLKYDSVEYYGSDDLWVSVGEYNVCVYKQGKWAEIVSSTPDITINGYKVEFMEEAIKIGCQEVEESVIYDLYQAIDNFNCGRELYYISSINIKGTNVTIEQIKEINDYFNKR